MEQLKLFLYDLFTNLIPGTLLLGYILMTNLFTEILTKIGRVEYINKNYIVNFLFIFTAYILGNGLNFIWQFIESKCKKEFFHKEDTFSMTNFSCNEYEKVKELLRQKNLLGIVEKAEAKYLLFRNSALAMGIIVILNFKTQILNIETILFIILLIVICYLKYIKYWNLSGRSLKYGKEIYEKLSKNKP